MFNCYLFSASVKEVATYRYSQFADFTDLYTSFLFNLLANSLQIKNIAVSISTAQEDQDWPLMVEDICKLIRIMLDFESSNAGSLNSGSSLNQVFNE